MPVPSQEFDDVKTIYTSVQSIREYGIHKTFQSLPKDKNVLTPKVLFHKDVILLAMSFVKAYYQLLCLASDRKPSGRS